MLSACNCKHLSNLKNREEGLKFRITNPHLKPKVAFDRVGSRRIRECVLSGSLY
jgi:hypothetical protein